MIAVAFRGNAQEIAAAEDWCERLTEYRWAAQETGDGRYQFIFEHPFDAQSFRQRHRTHTTQPYQPVL